jgi:hypothetical protein
LFGAGEAYGIAAAGVVEVFFDHSRRVLALGRMEDAAVSEPEGDMVWAAGPK